MRSKTEERRKRIDAAYYAIILIHSGWKEGGKWKGRRIKKNM